MSKTCGSPSVGLVVGVLLLVFLLVCGIGCAWHWKYRDTVRLSFPRLLQRRSSRREDYAKTLCWSSPVRGSSPKTSDETKDHKRAVKGARMHNNYENVEAGVPKDKQQAVEALYENTAQFAVEEHVYGNQPSSHYYNFQGPHTSEALQEENVYILPD